MKETTKMSRTIGYVEKIYRLLNERYFENALSMPIITIQSTPKAYGHITVAKAWKRKDEKTYELNLGAGTLDRNIEEVVATLTHEMCHQWNLDHNIQDTSRGYTYHNKAFKERAEKSGLIIEHHDTYGWTITTPSEEMIQFCLDNDLTEILINRDEGMSFGRGGGRGGASGTGRPTVVGKKPSSTRKYICPCCGNSVRATKTVNIICGDCMERMTEV